MSPNLPVEPHAIAMATKTALQGGSATSNGAHTSQPSSQKTAIAPKRRKTGSKKVEDEGLMATLCTLICHHQIGALTLPFLT